MEVVCHTRSHTWTTNPHSGLAWTWNHIDALQIGVAVPIIYSGDSIYCSQVYIEVNYTPSGGQ